MSSHRREHSAKPRSAKSERPKPMPATSGPTDKVEATGALYCSLRYLELEAIRAGQREIAFLISVARCATGDFLENEGVAVRLPGDQST